jgi:two-component system, LytTR family, response regulator
MKSHSAIIIDDEKNVREALFFLLKKYCPEIKVAGTAASAEEGRELLKTRQVDFIFLDISMPREDGFAFLHTIPKEDYGIIFITAHEEYALRALKASAIDYLLKPVNPIELKDAISKAVQYHELRQSRENIKRVYEESLNDLHENIHTENRPITRITVAEQFGFRVLNVGEIMYLEADSNYTIIHLSGLKKIVATRTMGDFEKILNTPEFFRIHKSIIMNDGTSLSISRRRLNEFREAVKQFSKTID